MLEELFHIIPDEELEALLLHLKAQADETTFEPTPWMQQLAEAGFNEAGGTVRCDWQTGLYRAINVYHELENDELRTWREHYRVVQPRRQYRGFSPTSKILRFLGYADQLGCFDRIETWTNSCGSLATEAMQVGVIVEELPGDKTRERFFAIVRWGNCLSLSREAVIRKYKREERVAWATLPLLLAVLAAVCLAVLTVPTVTVMLLFDLTYWQSMLYVGGSLACVTVIWIGIMVNLSKRRRRQLASKSSTTRPPVGRVPSIEKERIDA